MDRRAILKLGAGFSAAILLARQVFSAGDAGASEVAPLNGLPLAAATPFAEDTVIEQARLLAKSPYLPPEDTVPQSYKDLNYDRYRAIRFKKSLALWSGGNPGLTAELFSAGYIYRTPVRIFMVEGGQSAEIEYDPDIFTYGPEVSRPPDGARPGFSGLRIHAPIDKPGVMDEFAVFQGASYFRAKPAGLGYGMSGRGLAINTAQPPADEFPIFRSYWLVKPAPGAPTVTVFALLDSVSVSGAYKFVISAGYNTIMDVDCTLFPRATMPYAGIAPLTSMFYFAPGNSFRADEARLSVHEFRRPFHVEREGRAHLAPAHQSQTGSVLGFRRQRYERFRPLAARAQGGPLPGFRRPLRNASQRLGGTKRELGRRFGRSC